MAEESLEKVLIKVIQDLDLNRIEVTFHEAMGLLKISSVRIFIESYMNDRNGRQISGTEIPGEPKVAIAKIPEYIQREMTKDWIRGDSS